MTTDIRKIAALLTIPLFLLIIAALAASGNKTVFEPPLLLPLMNTLFLGLIPLSIAYIAGRTYRANGSLSVLLLGAGMLVFGLGSIAAGWLNGLPGGSNITATIHNTAVFTGGLFSLAAVLLVLARPRSGTEKGSRILLFGLYGSIAMGVALFSYAAVIGAVPPFFIQGTGPTLLRQIILSDAAEMFALAAFLFFVLYSRKRDDFFFWFSIALGLVTIGLLAVFLQPAVGSALGWAGRCSQYAGACFALAAMISARNEAATEGMPLTDRIDRFFGGGEATSAILSATTESIWLFETDGTILLANPIAFGRFGLKDASAVIGHNIRELLPPDLAKSRKERMDEVVHTRQPVRFEDVREGITFDHSFYPVLDTNGAVTGIASFSRDITETKRAEEELAKTNAKLSEVLGSIGDDFYVLDREWKFVYANRQFTSRVGKEPEDFIGHVIWDMFPKHRGTIFEENAKAAMENRETRRFEVHGRYTDTWYSMRIFPSMEGVTVLGADITDRKRAEGELRKKQAEIHALFENIPAGLVLFDAVPPYRVLVHNRFYQELFAEPFFSRGMAGLNVYEYAPEVEASGVVEVLDEAVRTRQPRHVLDFPYRANPAKESWFNWYLAPIVMEGEVVSLVSMSVDITDRHRVVEALKQSESQLRHAEELLNSVTESSGVMIAAEDRDLCYTYFNRAYASEIKRISGKDLVIGMCMNDLFADLPEEQANSERQWKKVLAGNRIKETVSFDSPAGERRIFNIIHTPIRDGTGAIVGAGEVSFEITRQVHIEEELRETSKYLENLINSANAPIIVWDPEFRITRFNEAFERLTGLAAEDVIGKTPDILIPEKHRQEAMELIRRATTGDRWEVVEIPIRHRSGKVRTVLWNSATLYQDNSRTIIATIAQGQEITQRKEAEDQMRVEKKRAEEALSLLNAALEATTEGIYVVDSSRRVTSYNQNFVALWNIPGDLLASRNDQKISRFMQERVEGQKDFAEHLTEIYQHPERESYDMLTLLDGRIFERHSRPQRLGKAIIGRVWSYLDVTDWRLAERSLVASVHEKEILIREIHHRVKNNLQIISGLLDMTRMRTPDSMTRGILTDMMMKIKTMAQIHTRLYESKQFERINMGSQIRDQVTDLSSIYGKSGTEIETGIHTEDFFLPVDQAIPCALIVNEVLSNAFKHAFTGRTSGTLDVMAIQADGRIRIRIRDDGIGIPKDVDPDRTTSLGLKLIRSLVQQLNGSVAIKSDHGTEVAIEFPLPAGGR